MAQRSTAPRDPKVIRRTLHWFWWVTKKRPFAAFMAVFTSVAYTALLNYANTYVMSRIVDRISAQVVPAAQVFSVFVPYVIALLVVNAVGQTCSKLQDWSVMQLEMNGNYHLARLCFDTLSNQSMTFHTSRFGGSLVSQTSRFMGGYVGLVDVVVYSLISTLASIVCTIVLLWPASPLFVCILFVMLTVYVVVAYTYNLSMRFNYINSMMARMNRAVGDAAEMTKVLDEPRLVEDAPGAPELVVTDGAVEFERLAFRYEDAAEGDYVFDGLTLSVPAGQRVGLVGRSGSGKTTLTKLLLRLSDVQEGHVLVDGQDISTCAQQSLRRQIAYVPQEALLFHRSIRENIAYGRPDATDGEVREAARLANALEFVDRLPAGLDTMVGERGVKLSGGQRQRVAIARAILADCPILVLDEATSALDSESC